MALPNPFGNTNTGLIGNINRATGASNIPTPSTQTPTIGVKAATPTPTPPVNTLPPAQVKKSTPIVSNKNTSGGTLGSSISFNPEVQAKQAALNKANLNTQGYIPLIEDGKLGPKTQDALMKYGNSLSTPTQNTQQPTQSQTTQPPYQPTDNGLYGKLVTDLANRSQQSGGDYQNAQAEAQRISDEQTKLAQDYAQKTNNIAGTAGFLTQQTGLQGQLNNQYNTVQNALASQYSGATNRLGAANTQQGLLQQAIQQAAGLASPQLAGFNQQAFSPISGQFSAGGSLNDAVSNVIQKLQSGQMSYNDALTALSGYGQGGVNALQQALPQGFNVAQSNTLAAQQGSIKPAYDYAKQALGNLQNAVSGLYSAQNTNVPIINQLFQGASTIFGVGSQGVQAYKGALAEARGAIQKVLAATQGGTPTDYVGQSNALLPDNATPNQIAAAAETLDTLGQAKVNIYGNPGQSGNQPSSGTIQTKYGAINPNL